MPARTGTRRGEAQTGVCLACGSARAPSGPIRGVSRGPVSVPRLSVSRRLARARQSLPLTPTLWVFYARCTDTLRVSIGDALRDACTLHTLWFSMRDA